VAQLGTLVRYICMYMLTCDIFFSNCSFLQRFLCNFHSYIIHIMCNKEMQFQVRKMIVGTVICSILCCRCSVQGWLLVVLSLFLRLQVTVHIKGKTECYECQPKPAPKSYPVCTITSTPSKVIFLHHLGQFFSGLFLDFQLLVFAVLSFVF